MPDYAQPNPPALWAIIRDVWGNVLWDSGQGRNARRTGVASLWIVGRGATWLVGGDVRPDSDLTRLGDDTVLRMNTTSVQEGGPVSVSLNLSIDGSQVRRYTF